MKIRILIIIVAFVLSKTGITSGQTNAFINGQIAYSNKQYKQALDLVDQHLHDFPKNKKAIKLQIDLLIELRDYQAAIDKLNKLKVSDYDDIDLLYARAYAGLQKNDKAFEYLNKYMGSTTKLPEPEIKSLYEFQVLKNNSSWINIWKTDKYTEKENILNNAKYAIKSGNNAEAADRLDEYLAKYTRSAEAYYLRGNIYSTDKDYKSAFDCYDKALKIEPGFEECIIAQAGCRNNLGKYQAALDQFNEIIRKDSLIVDAYLGRAKSLLETGNYEQAKEDISRFRSYYPDNTDALYLEGTIDTKSGDFLSAISEFGKLIKSNPANEEYFIGRANAYMETKTYKYAIRDYSMALDLNPKNIKVFKLKAKAHQMVGEMTQACFEWQHAANLGDVEAMDDLYKYCK